MTRKWHNAKKRIAEKERMSMTERKYLKGGDRNPSAKVEVDMEEAERRIAGGEKVKELAAELGIHPSTFYRKRREYRKAADKKNV